MTATEHRDLRPGFTLIELVVAVALLVLLMLAVGFVLDMAGGAIDETQAAGEMAANSANFVKTLRGDIRGTERDGWMIMGRRDMTGVYGSQRLRSRERIQTARCDWLELVTNTEMYSALDNRVIGQWARILYSHGPKTDPKQSGYSQFAINWVVMRHQILECAQLPISIWDVQTTNAGPYSGKGVFEGLEWPGSGDYIGAGRPWQRAVDSYYNRDLRWYWFMNYGWTGEVLTPNYNFTAYGGALSTGTGYDEPNYWQTASFYSSGTLKRFHALPHCGQFQIEFAFAEDLRAGENGSIRWRSPPALGDTSYEDPNYRPGDPLHPSARLPGTTDVLVCPNWECGGYATYTTADPYLCPACQTLRANVNAPADSQYRFYGRAATVLRTDQSGRSGRLAFGPGDKWPVLLRVTTTTYDPKERVDQGKTMTAIIPVAQ